ncbi:MAG: SDR family NAD(P)-dependent oxidoreductase [Acidimicrobiia bacterium]|nr:SDR family NAD(P)-dependent oxidoreductase [Acidimicrobiia bacterium]
MSETAGARRFADRVALVTGAGRGIGAAVAERLATEGASVACLDIDAEGAADTAARIAERGADSFSAVCDVGDEQSVVDTVAAVVDRFGRLDVTVNMAGILSAVRSHEETLDNWNRILRVNLTGTFLVCRESIPHLLLTKGNIVNAASTSSLSGHPWMAAYGSSKGGVYMLSNSLAIEYAKRGMRVNCVAPGGIDTDMTRLELPDDVDFDILTRMLPIGRMGKPPMVADAVAFLASDDARFVNGEILRVDGATLA